MQNTPTSLLMLSHELTLLCSVLVVPDVKSPFQLVLWAYFPPPCPESVNGKFIKLFSVSVITTWAGMKHTNFLESIVQNCGPGSLFWWFGNPVVLKAVLFFSFLSYFLSLNKPHILLLNLYFVHNVKCVCSVYTLCELRETGWVDISGQVPTC